MTGTAEKARLTTDDWLARAAAVAPRMAAFIDGRFVPAASGETLTPGRTVDVRCATN